MEIKLEIQSGELVIKYLNNTSSVIRIWQSDNSWGWENLSFILRIENTGTQINITRAKTMGWTKNGPGYFEILPGQEIITPVQLTGKSWEADQTLSIMNNEIVSVKALLNILSTPEAKELDVWIGKAESDWLKVSPPHNWLFNAN